MCDKYVYNYKELGEVYIEQGDLVKGKELIKKAYDNIVNVYDGIPYDTTDINEYINEYVKGTHLSDINKETIEEMLNK